MQNQNANKLINNIPKQSKTYPIQKQEESEEEPVPMNYNNKVKKITALNNPTCNNINEDSNLNSEFKKNTAEKNEEIKNQIRSSDKAFQNPSAYNNSTSELKKFEDKNCLSNENNKLFNNKNLIKADSNSNLNIENNSFKHNSNNVYEDVEIVDDEEEKPKDLFELKKYSNFASSTNNQTNNSINNNLINNIKRDSIRSNNSSSNNKNNNNVADVHDTKKNSSNINNQPNSGNINYNTNSNTNFKANTMEYTLNSNANSNASSNQNINSYSLRQNKVGAHTYTRLAERMKNSENNIPIDNIPYYTKNRNDSKGKLTSEIYDRLHNNNKEKNINKENTPNNYNSVDNNKNNINSNSNNYTIAAKNPILNNPENHPNSNNSEKNKFIMGCEGIIQEESSVKQKKGDVTPKSPLSDTSPKANNSSNHKKKNKDRAAYEINHDSSSKGDDNNNIIENSNQRNDLINNYNPNYNNNLKKIPNMKNFEEEEEFTRCDEKNEKSLMEMRKNSNIQKNVIQNYDPNSVAENIETINIFSNKQNNANINSNNQNSNYNSNNITTSNITTTNNNFHTNNNIKTQNSKALLTESKYAQYDTQQLCYDLVKEYAHLKIDKDEDFMRRMLFDIFKRQTKEERLEKLIEKNKVKIDENERIKTFNRLIEDANRRIEAQDQMEDMKILLDQKNVSSKKYKFEEWEEIYQDRFLRHQKYKDKWIEEMQLEKKKQEELHEQEIVDLCKTVKKPQEEIENFVHRMYLEAERRQLKFSNKSNKNRENKINIDDFISKANLDKDIRNITPTIFNPTNKNKSKQPKYQFQSDMSGNENSEDDNNFLSKVKELKEKNLSNSPAVRKSPQRQFFSNPNDLIKESPNENNYEEHSMYDTNNTNNNTKDKYAYNKGNQKPGWNNFYNSKNTKNYSSHSNFNNQNLTTHTSKNTEINNKRFEVEPTQNKRNMVSNFIKSTPSKNIKAEKPSSNKNYKSKNNNPINVYSEHLKNLEQLEQRNFLIEEDDNVMVQSGINLKPKFPKRPMSKPSYNRSLNNNQNKTGQNLKYMPDHLASKIVDDILSTKFSQD